MDEPSTGHQNGQQDVQQDGQVRRPGTVDVSAVVGGLAVVAVAVAVAVHEITGQAWDWRWYAAGVLVVAGLAVVAATARAALRERFSGGARGCR